MGGGATRANNVVKGLLVTGCKVTVVSAFPHYPTGQISSEFRRKAFTMKHEGQLRIIRVFVPPLASEGVVKRILLFGSFLLSSLFALPLIRKVDAVWAANPNILSMFSAFIYKVLHRCPLVQNVDDLWPESLFDMGLIRKSFLSKLGTFLAKLAYRAASVITTISPAYNEVLTRKYQVNPQKISVLPAGVDLSCFPLKRQRPRKIKGKFRVLYIGAFSPAYDFDQVFYAAKTLSSLSDIEFVIQGGGELASALKSKIRRLRLRNVQLVEKIVSRDEVARILSEADTVLLPLGDARAIEQGISSKLYEYQAARKPIICCSSGQPGKYVLTTKSGIVVKPGDYQALAKAVITLKDDDSLRRKLGHNGRKHVEKNLGIERIGEKMRCILETACGYDRE